MDSLAALHSSRKSVILRAMAERDLVPEPVARLLYVLGSFRDPERVNPSQIWLAKKLDCTVEWVRRVTRRAEQMCLLEVERRPGRRTRRYRVRWGRLEELAGDLLCRVVGLVRRALGGPKAESWGIVKTSRENKKTGDGRTAVAAKRASGEGAKRPAAGTRPVELLFPGMEEPAKPKKAPPDPAAFLIPEVLEKPAPKPRPKAPPKPKPKPARPGYPAWRALFCERWAGKFGGARYPWTFGRDDKQLCRIYDTLNGDFERFRALLTHYLLIDTTSRAARWSETRGFDVCAMAYRLSELISA